MSGLEWPNQRKQLGGAVESDTIHLNQTSTARLKAAFKQIYAKAATGVPQPVCASPFSLIKSNAASWLSFVQDGEMQSVSTHACVQLSARTHAQPCHCNARLSSLPVLARFSCRCLGL